MKKIIFVSACKTKTYKSGLAREMYVGQFSEKAYRYATKIDVEKDELVFLTPKGYWEGVTAILHREGKSTENFKTPLIGLMQGEQIGWITDKLCFLI